MLYVKHRSAGIEEAQADKSLDELMADNQIVVATPDDAVVQIRCIEQKVPDFGCVLIAEKNWQGSSNRRNRLMVSTCSVLQ